MKLFSIFFLASTVGFATNAQIVLTSTDFGTGGDEALVSAQLFYVGDFASTGEDYFWDFTDLVPTSQEMKVFGPMSDISGLPNFMFGSFASANYQASYYQDANIPIDQLGGLLPVQLDDILQYSKITSTAVNSLGYSMSLNGTAVPIKSDTIETRYALPLSFNDSYFSRGYTKLNMNPILDAQWIQHRTRTTVADGWGDVKTPYGNYYSLRLKHIITETDSVNYQGTWFEIPIPTTIEYEWWTNTVKVPLLKITTVEIGGTEQITNVEYRDDVWLGVSSLENFEAKVFPNPISDVLNVHLSDDVQKIEIVDLTGKTVFVDASPTLINHYSIEDLKSGIYQVKITSDDKVSRTSLVKK